MSGTTSGYVNKGSPYFVGHPNTVSVYYVGAGTSFLANSGANVELDSQNTVVTLPNTFSIDGGELTYNGNSGLFYITYQVSSHLSAVTADVFFYIVINNSLQSSSVQSFSMGTALMDVCGSMYTTLNDGDVIYIGFRNSGANDTLVVQNIVLSCSRLF